MLASQSNFQSRYWASSAKSQARSKTPTYHLLYGQKSAIVTRSRVNEPRGPELRNVNRTSNLAEWLESRYKKDRSNSSKSQATARENLADLPMDRQRILPAMPFNNSLYPHLKAKTAASVKPRVRRADDGNDTIILRNAPVIEPGLKAERAYTSGVLYTHVQSATESSSGRLNANSNSTEWTESKPAPFIVRQKLA